MAIVTGSWLVDAFLTIFSLIFALYFYYRKQFQFWAKLNVPHTEPTFPMGDTGQISITKSVNECFKDIYESAKGQKFIGMWSMFRPMLLIRDPELIKRVFVKDFTLFQDRGIYVNEKDDPLSAHLFSIGGPKWRNLRTKLTPTFTSGKMKMMFPMVLECCDEFKNVLDGSASRNEVIEMKDLVARFTTDSISSCAFGIQTNSLKDPDAIFRVMGRKIFEPSMLTIMRSSMAFFAPKVAELLNMRTTRKDVEKYFLNEIRSIMEYREKNHVKRNDFMHLIIQLKNLGKIGEGENVKNGHESEEKLKTITFEEAAAQVYVFFIGGFETSATTLQFAFYEMALNPDMQEKARSEIKTVLEKHNGEITYEAIYEMDYVGRIVDETLRKYVPFGFLQRECNRDYQIPDTDIVIPKGTTVMISSYGLHHDPEHFPNPSKFDPHRFTEEEKAKRHHYAYLPFGDGPRNCIGARFGIMQTKLGLITLLKNFKLEVCEETPIPVKIDPKILTLTPIGGMNLRISKI